MIQALIAFVLIALLVAFVYQSVSKFTLSEYKLAFKVGAAATASLLILFVITQVF
jgi:hypothetical protein